MIQKEYKDYFKDIVDSIDDIESFTKGFSQPSFIKDKKTVNAVIRSLEIIGEAAKQIPEDMRAKYPDIPWKKMAGMRDKLIHEYSGVDVDIIWQVIKEDVPLIKPLINKIFNSF